MSKKIIATELAPKAIGPYSQGTAIDCKQLVFVSGQIPLDPATGKLVDGGIVEQTDRVLKNVTAILTAAGSAMDKVLKTTVYLKSMDDFKAMNEVYNRHFTHDCPARATVQVAKLPMDVMVEIDAIAYLD